MRFLLIYPNSTGNTKVPLGLLYLLQIARQAGHEAELFDMTFHGVHLEKHDIHIRGRMLNFRPLPLEPWGVTYARATMADVHRDLAGRLRAFRPDLVGISITEDTSTVGFALGATARAVRPEARLIYGGVFCLTEPELVLARPEADLVCVGEGETAMAELLRRWGDWESILRIPGLWGRNARGEPVRNPVGPPLALDELPCPDLSLIDDRHLFNPMAGHVYKMTFVEGQRGCPRRCTYCCNQLFLDAYREHGRAYLRRKSIPRLVDELALLKERHGINFFQFTDDDFLLRDEGELGRFRDLYRERVALPFWIQAEANQTTGPKAALIREAGCIAVSMGIETGSERIRWEIYRRHTTPEATIRAFAALHDQGIRTSGNVIIGVPDEGRAEIFETIRLVRRCRPRSLNVNIFAPYRGTALRELCVRRGYLEPGFLREGAGSWRAVLEMPQISREEVEGLARTFVLYATLPEELWPRIALCERPGPEAERHFGELEPIFWEIAGAEGIDVDVPGFDYDTLLAARRAELAARGGDPAPRTDSGCRPSSPTGLNPRGALPC